MFWAKALHSGASSSSSTSAHIFDEGDIISSKIKVQIIIIWHCSSILPLGAGAGASTSNRARGTGASTSNRARTSISNRARASTRDEARANIKIIWLSVPTTSKELVLALGKSLVLALAPGSQGKSKSFCVRASKKYLQNPT